jgi:alanine transaminase
MIQGNPQSLEQTPLTYIRDILSLVINPSLKQRTNFPADIISRAEKYLSGIPSVGAYSDSQGILAVREEICQFLRERDGFEADPWNIFLTNGASDGVRLCMQTIMRDTTSGFRDGVMTPIPQYPLYSALITLLNGAFVAYHLNEDEDWSCTPDTLTESLYKAKNEGITVRALVIINPGNPTGFCFHNCVFLILIMYPYILIIIDSSFLILIVFFVYG